MNTEYQELLKRNALALAKEHKMQCNNASCVISIYLVGELLREARIELTKEEFRELI